MGVTAGPLGVESRYGHVVRGPIGLPWLESHRKEAEKKKNVVSTQWAPIILLGTPIPSVSKNLAHPSLRLLSRA